MTATELQLDPHHLSHFFPYVQKHVKNTFLAEGCKEKLFLDHGLEKLLY